MECTVISKCNKISLIFQLSEGTGVLSKPIIIMLKQNYDKSTRYMEGKDNRRKTTLKILFVTIFDINNVGKEASNYSGIIWFP